MLKTDEMNDEDLLEAEQAFENAICANGAIGGSTNAVVHLLALARRIRVKLTLDNWDRLGRDLPCLVNLMPSGEYLMEDFYYAGGLPVVLRELGNFALPSRILKKGITDMVRISDARMSGTAYGTVVLHSAPEAAAGGPLALVQDGDMIEIDVRSASCISTYPMRNWSAAARNGKRRTRWRTAVTSSYISTM